MPIEPAGAGWQLRHPPPYDDLPPADLVSTDQFTTLRPVLTLVWEQAGWDAAAADPRHHTLVIRDLFTPGRRPAQEQLDRFRSGFAAHRAGRPRPDVRGSRAAPDDPPPAQVETFIRRVALAEALAEDAAIAAAAERATALGAGVRVRRTSDGLLVEVDPTVPVGEVHVHQGFTSR